jgi:electron transport complex protein RnfE
MATIRFRELSIDGLWRNNPALVQLLGLCPLLAASGTVATALGLGLATTLVLMLSGLAVSLVRAAVPDAVRLPVFRADHRHGSHLHRTPDAGLRL